MARTVAPVRRRSIHAFGALHQAQIGSSVRVGLSESNHAAGGSRRVSVEVIGQSPIADCTRVLEHSEAILIYPWREP